MKTVFALILGLALCAPINAGAASVPAAADSIGEQIDKQVVQRFSSFVRGEELSRKERERRVRSGLIIFGTVPADISNLNSSCPLARQMSEEVARYLVSLGYRYKEIRKGRAVRFHPMTGELILTRDVRELAEQAGTGHAVLAGTYTISGKDVRFSMRVIQVSSNDVLGMGTATVPISEDVVPMLYDIGATTGTAGLGTGSPLQ